MAAAERIDDKTLRKLSQIAAKQPARTSRNALINAVLLKTVNLCKDDPTAWMDIDTMPDIFNMGRNS